jgi:hypothetical protein
MAQGVRIDANTVRQMQQLRAAGLSTHRIAAALGVNPSSVAKHAPAGKAKA